MKPGRNTPCHCGSGKKYKKCHGANTSSALLPVSTKQKVGDPDLISVSNRVLDSLETFSASVQTQEAVDRFFPQVCAYHHAHLLHSVIKASTILAQHGCGSQVYSLRRAAFEHWLWNQYYARHPEQACLYVASAVFEQRRLGRKWSEADPSVDFSTEHKIYEEQIEKLKERYPKAATLDETDDDESTVRIYCVTCRQRLPGRRQIRIRRLDLLSLTRFIFRENIREHPEFVPSLRKRYNLGSDLSDKQVADIFAKHQYMMNATYPGQQLHGLPLSLIPSFPRVPGTFTAFEQTFDDPNPLLWGMLHFCIEAIDVIGRVNSIAVDELVEPLRAEVERVADKLGIK